RDGADLPAELLRRLGGALAIEAAEHERGPVLLRKPTDLVVEDRLKLQQGSLRQRARRAGGVNPRIRLSFPCPPTSGVAFGFHGNPISDSMQPTGDSLALANGLGFRSRHEKGPLKGGV